jgi:hypothetical protein
MNDEPLHPADDAERWVGPAWPSAGELETYRLMAYIGGEGIADLVAEWERVYFDPSLRPRGLESALDYYRSRVELRDRSQELFMHLHRGFDEVGPPGGRR